VQELSDYQRRISLKNPNVEKLTDKHVVYTYRLEIKAIERYLKGFKPDDIFKEAEIEPEYFTKDYCRFCIKKWKKKYFEEGRESLRVSQTGKKATGRTKSIDTDEMTIEELRAMVEIQHEVIDMLKKNRTLAKKKEEK
jgi:hypothetical protein